jgi:hypothetical protein
LLPRIGFFELFILLFSGIIPVVGVIIFIVLAWRITKAQESMADSIREIARKIQGGQ